MNWVDLILNIAGLLLWFNWRAGKIDPLGKRTPATLIGTLRSATPEKMRRWELPAVLGALIFLRAVFYWLIGPALRWAGILNFGVISLSFRSDWFGRILLFSFLSFVLTLGIVYSWLILLSLLRGPKPVHDFVRMQLGRIDDWPPGVKLSLPLVVTAISWWLVSWVLARFQIIPLPISEAWRVEESFIIALQSYLIWNFPLAAILVLHLLNSYIYFGRHPVWNYADVTAQKLLRPLKKIPLRLGKVDFAPVVGIALVFFVSEFAGRGLGILYKRLSL
jgi:uncharacterized protein YggT (Ycf19 family)